MFIRFTHYIRKNRNEHDVGEAWFKSLPLANAALYFMASRTCRGRVAVCPARIPDARRYKTDTGICASECRQPRRRRATADAAAVTTKGRLMFIIPWSEGAAANGASRLHIRTATERDVDGLAEHFGRLSCPSRYNRFMGAVSNFSRIAFDCLVQNRRADRFTLIAEVQHEAREAVIGEASYAVEGRTGLGEFAISVCDGWQHRGLGSALLLALQWRAVSLGYFGLYGETLKTNDQMKALARKAGFVAARSDDWRAVRFHKQLLDRPRDVTGARRTAPSLWWPRELTNTE